MDANRFKKGESPCGPIKIDDDDDDDDDDFVWPLPEERVTKATRLVCPVSVTVNGKKLRIMKIVWLPMA
jgi:hypothetical protein